jgi:hypothetical protein
MDIDEDALLMNLAIGTDLPTSIAGSITDAPSPASSRGLWTRFALLAAIVLSVLVWLLSR